MKNAVIVAMGRSAIGKSGRGSLCHTRPEDLGAQILRGVLAQVPQLDPGEIEDVILGCAFPEAEQGMNLAKVVAARAGLPFTVPGQTVNRFCSSGLQTIATAANTISCGQAEILVAGGVESMSHIPIGGNTYRPHPELNVKEYTSMGITAENVADQYNITRQMQDEFACESHHRAAAAQTAGKLGEEIISVEATAAQRTADGLYSNGKKLFTTDEGIRSGVTPESLAKLKPPFKTGGTVTAGNSSQTSDGAAFVVLMEAERAKAMSMRPIARLVTFAVAGVPAEIMGIGPIRAIPSALKLAGLELEDIDLIELNEAFASQALACIQELGLNTERVNVNGGAIALGHPLGCTGTLLTVKLLHELRRQGRQTGIVSMCVAGGIGAAGIFRLYE